MLSGKPLLVWLHRGIISDLANPKGTSPPIPCIHLPRSHLNLDLFISYAKVEPPSLSKQLISSSVILSVGPELPPGPICRPRLLYLWM